jgi:predicted dehydrogenase
VLDGVPHLVYSLEFLLGPIERVDKVAASGASRMEAEDASVGTLRFDAGNVATVRVSYADRVPGHDQGWPAAWNMGFDLHGTGGQIRVELAPTARLSVYDGEGEPTVMDFDDEFSSSFQGAVDEFLSAVDQGRQPRVTPRESLRTLAHVLDA